MRVSLPGLFLFLVAIAAVSPIQAQAPDNFRWIDFHAQTDQDVVVWVTRALTVEKWTAIREIGVEYDSALVVTTARSTPQSAAIADTFTVWNVSLTDHAATALLKGVNLRLLDWMLLSQGRPRELAAFYDNCIECAASTYFTTFHYDVQRRAWVARWINGEQAAPAWSAAAIAGIASLEQAYAVLAQPDGREYLATWRHFDFGKDRKSEDYVYVYDVDQFTGQDRTQLITAKQAGDLMQRLCRAQDAVEGLARGQDSPLCQPAVKARPEHHPVTTPPANNHGKSVPPGSQPKAPQP